VSEWISVKDRSPELGERVLIFEWNGNIQIGLIRKKIPAWFSDSYRRVLGVSYWMPLPEPPKEAHLYAEF
jgi:hypothetical protein